MTAIVALIVFFATLFTGVLTAIWRLGGLLAHHADRFGVGTVRAGAVVQKVRFTVLLWAAASGIVALALAWWMWSHTAIVVALVLGLAAAVAAVVLAPLHVPRLLVMVARRVSRRVRGGRI
ncbi:MAG: hypothetical protein U0Y82_15450 [Thermoleophilia bacterium]